MFVGKNRQIATRMSSIKFKQTDHILGRLSGGGVTPGISFCIRRPYTMSNPKNKIYRSVWAIRTSDTSNLFLRERCNISRFHPRSSAFVECFHEIQFLGGSFCIWWKDLRNFFFFLKIQIWSQNNVVFTFSNTRLY